MPAASRRFSAPPWSFWPVTGMYRDDDCPEIRVRLRAGATRSRSWILAVIALMSCGAAAAQRIDLVSEQLTDDGVIFDVSFAMPGHPGAAGLQWTFLYPPADIWAFTITPGPAAVDAGKVPVCSGQAGGYTCVLVGVNQNLIHEGVIARVRAATVPGSKSIHINVADTIAATTNGSMLPIVAGRGFAIASSAISSLSCSSSQIIAPGSVACTVALATIAPNSGAVVNITYTGSAGPDSVTIPAAARSADFEVKIATPEQQQKAAISARYQSSSLDTFIHLAHSIRKSACADARSAPAAEACVMSSNGVPRSHGAPTTPEQSTVADSKPAQYRAKGAAEKNITCGLPACSLWDKSAVPKVPAAPDDHAVEVGLRFQALADIYVKAIRFYKGTENRGSHIAHLWTAAGELLATAPFGNETEMGWQEANLDHPVRLTRGDVYVASYYAPYGHYAATTGFFRTAGIHKGIVYALPSGQHGGNGLFRYGATASFPTETYQSTNYWVDVVVSVE